MLTGRREEQPVKVLARHIYAQNLRIPLRDLCITLGHALGPYRSLWPAFVSHLHVSVSSVCECVHCIRCIVYTLYSCIRHKQAVTMRV